MTNTNISALSNPYQNSGSLTYTPTIPRTNYVFINDLISGETVISQVGLSGYKTTVLTTDPNIIQIGNSNNAAIWTEIKNRKTSIENAYGHWDKHKGEFPELQNSLEYVKATNEFLNNPPTGSMI